MTTAERALWAVDTDLDYYGDDSTAILLLLGAGETVSAIGAVSGNVWSDQAAADTQRLLEAAGYGEVPVHPGLAPEALEARLRFYWEVERVSWARDAYAGAFGFGRVPPPPSPPPGGWPRGRLRAEPAPAMLAALVNAHPRRVNVLLLGPATHLAAALQADPGLADRIGHVHVFGGALRVPGNVTPAAEFNFWFDPEAAEAVLRAGLPLTLMPLDATAEMRFPHEWARYAGSANPAAAHLGASIADRVPRLGGLAPRLYDELLVAAILDPTLVTESREEPIEVVTERTGDYGRSRLGGGRRRSARVIYALDLPRVRAWLEGQLHGNRVAPV